MQPELQSALRSCITAISDEYDKEVNGYTLPIVRPSELRRLLADPVSAEYFTRQWSDLPTRVEQSCVCKIQRIVDSLPKLLCLADLECPWDLYEEGLIGIWKDSFTYKPRGWQASWQLPNWQLCMRRISLSAGQLHLKTFQNKSYDESLDKSYDDPCYWLCETLSILQSIRSTGTVKNYTSSLVHSLKSYKNYLWTSSHSDRLMNTWIWMAVLLVRSFMLPLPDGLVPAPISNALWVAAHFVSCLSSLQWCSCELLRYLTTLLTSLWNDPQELRVRFLFSLWTLSDQAAGIRSKDLVQALVAYGKYSVCFLDLLGFAVAAILVCACCIMLFDDLRRMLPHFFQELVARGQPAGGSAEVSEQQTEIHKRSKDRNTPKLAKRNKKQQEQKNKASEQNVELPVAIKQQAEGRVSDVAAAMLETAALEAQAMVVRKKQLDDELQQISEQEQMLLARRQRVMDELESLRDINTCPSDDGQEEDVEDEDECCIVCLDADKSHLLWPCGHQCVCGTCSYNIVPGLCPLCRVWCTAATRVFK